MASRAKVVELSRRATKSSSQVVARNGREIGYSNCTDVVNGGHDIWDPTYDLSARHGDIYEWILDNAR